MAFSDGDTELIADGDVIMCDMAYYPWTPENIDDWYLIAAAPDMYEALKEACEFIADQYSDAESQAHDGEFVSREARPLWSKICSALAKAEGE